MRYVGLKDRKKVCKRKHTIEQVEHVCDEYGYNFNINILSVSFIMHRYSTKHIRACTTKLGNRAEIVNLEE